MGGSVNISEGDMDKSDNGWLDGGGMDRWTDGWMDEWMDG